MPWSKKWRTSISHCSKLIGSRVLKFVLVGCGRIAKRHADILASGLDGTVKLGAVCDVHEERARRFGKKYGVPWFGDYDRMMRLLGDVDVVSVLTPSGLHARHVIDLARYGRPIIVEKPLALTLGDADAMLAACASAGARLFVVLQNRFNPPVLKLREALDAGRFGKLVLGTARVRWCRTQAYYDLDAWRGTWALDGGILANQAIHHIDLLVWFLGRVESLFVATTCRLVDIEVEDTAVAIVKFANGALGVVEATNATRPVDLEGSISVLGEGGVVEIGGFAANAVKTWKFSHPIRDDAEMVSQISQNVPNVYGFGHLALLRQVVDALKNDTATIFDGLEGRKSLEVVHAMYRSVEVGREVYLREAPESRRLGRK